MLDLTRFCALCGSGLKVNYYDDDDLDTAEDCGCSEGNSAYSRQLRRIAEGRPTCEWFEEIGDPVMDRYVSYGPKCGKPAQFLSCTPYVNTYTCTEHKCRCAKPLPNEPLL